jgi:hypothetical protein
MVQTVAAFRAMWPEFGDTSVYPDVAVTTFLGLGYDFLNPEKWRSALDFGVGLYTAHQLAIRAQAVAAANVGGVPGTQGGVLASKAVDKVSAGYDVAAGTYEGAGYWNRTTYGVRLWDMVLMFGAGGFVTGGGPLPVGPTVGPWQNGGWPY